MPYEVITTVSPAASVAVQTPYSITDYIFSVLYITSHDLFILWLEVQETLTFKLLHLCKRSMEGIKIFAQVFNSANFSMSTWIQ